MAPAKVLVTPFGMGKKTSADNAKITKIEYHEKSGEVSLNTTRGPRKAFTFRLCHDMGNSGVYNNPADKYR